jgi:hypothetical protein
MLSAVRYLGWLFAVGMLMPRANEPVEAIGRAIDHDQACGAR